MSAEERHVASRIVLQNRAGLTRTERPQGRSTLFGYANVLCIRAMYVGGRVLKRGSDICNLRVKDIEKGAEGGGISTENSEKLDTSQTIGDDVGTRMHRSGT